MKTIVSVTEMLELELKPSPMVSQWRELVEIEIAERWKDRSHWITVGLPKCDQKHISPVFEKCGVTYFECRSCGSLFAPHRPSEDELSDYYRESAPAQFWREQLLLSGAEARLEKLTRPRADWIQTGIAEYRPEASRLVDISPHGRELLDLLVSENHKLKKIVAAGIAPDLDGPTTTRIKVLPCRTTDLPSLGPVDVIVAIDALDRAADCEVLIKAWADLLAVGGIIFATVPVASGFEIQALWDRSPTVLPPDKINLPSIKGLQQFFAEPTWEILELSTPGMFDVEIVRRAIELEPTRPWPRVVRSLIEFTSKQAQFSLVELLQAQRLTSFARLVVRKKV
jgi:hypothetical protein